MKVFLFSFLTAATASANLIISEINYHPADSDPTELTEFIEFKNTGDTAISLTGTGLAAPDFDGVNTVTLTQTSIEPGGFLVITKNASAFNTRYGFLPGGTFAGSLKNSGEEVGLTVDGESAQLTYWDGGDENPMDPDDNERPDWITLPDGNGPTLTLIRPNDPETEIEKFESWRASIQPGGSPGSDEPLPSILEPIVINEVRTRDGDLSNDAVEFFNPTDSPINIINWFLTDDLDSPQKLSIRSTTTAAELVVPANGYFFFPLSSGSLSLSSQGERVYLYSGDVNGNLTGYVDGFVFEGSADGRTFIRVANADGRIRYPQVPPSFGVENPTPPVADIIITELFYAPPTSTTSLIEFIEFANIGSSTVQLYDPANPTNNWRIEGVDFILNGTQPELAPGEVAIATPLSPEVFRSTFNVPTDVQIFGPYTRAFSNGGETAGLQRPENLDDADPTRISYIDVDEVLYDNNSPWPTEADGGGFSLVRSIHRKWADQSTDWQIGFIENGTPGILEDDYNLWSVRTFPELLLPTVDAPTNRLEDLDGDGFNNLFAYAFDLDPRSSTPQVLQLLATGDNPATSFPIRNNLNLAAEYFPEYSLTLANDSWTDEKQICIFDDLGLENGSPQRTSLLTDDPDFLQNIMGTNPVTSGNPQVISPPPFTNPSGKVFFRVRIEPTAD